MAEAGPASEAVQRRFLTFRVDSQLYALPAEQVSEVIRTPAVARVPQGPKSLLGLANLRGAVLPVATVRGLLGKAERAATGADRTIVLDGGAPAALAVDGIDGLVSISADRIETRPADLTAEAGEVLAGAFQPLGRDEVARILDVRTMLEAAFVQRARAARRDVERGVGPAAVASAPADPGQQLITFDVAGQEYGLPLEAVREVIPAPQTIAVLPRSETVVLGVMAYRDSLLPLLSLRGLLGAPPEAERDGEERVVVTILGGGLVGLVADGMRAVIKAAPELVDPVPPMLGARTGGEARVKAIFRGEGGRRLISILAPEQLFREDVMARLGGLGDTAPTAEDAGEQRQFLIFRLGDDEFGLPIEAVDEVARVPAQITRVPKTPEFLEGVINLRGEVLPVVDQRRRFDMPPLADGGARRLVVLRTDRHRAGVIVDSVSEVLRCAGNSLGEAPDLTGQATRLVNGVVNLESQGRMILLLDPAELLTRAEHGVLDAFRPQAESPAR